MHNKTRLSWNISLMWLLMATLAGVDTVGLQMHNLSVEPTLLRMYLLLIFLVLVLFFINKDLKSDPRIVAALHIESATISCAAVTLLLSYVATAFRQPLIDPYLVEIDHAVGFDWPTFYTWILVRPLFHTILRIAYVGVFPQIVLLQIVLMWHGHVRRGWELLWLFAVSCVICIVCSGFWPAIGAFGYFHILDDTPYVREFLALRTGTLKIIGHTEIQGIVQFPSFHAAMAVVYIYAARGIPILFSVVAVVNILMIIATLPIGGHHLADTLGGIALAVALIGMVRLCFRNTDAISPLFIDQ